MDPRSEWEAVEPLLDHALDLTPAERKSYLESLERKSPGLARSVAELLAAAEGTSGVMIDRSLEEVASELVERVPQDRATGLYVGAEVGGYELLEPLGEGGAGKVFRARRVDKRADGVTAPENTEVALKILLTDDVSGEAVQRFEQEMSILSRLKHPGVAPAFDFGESEHGLRYVAMRLIKGLPIVEFSRLHRLSVGENIGLIVKVCAAVQAAHDQGIVHRDLKPSNILIESVTTETGSTQVNPIVLDFGIARVGQRTGLTMTGQILGTPGYMSPEQARGASNTVTARSDVFSLGVVTYELLQGKNPFVRVSGVETLAAVIRAPVPEIVGAPALNEVVMNSLEKEPNERYQSVRAFGEALKEALLRFF